MRGHSGLVLLAVIGLLGFDRAAVAQPLGTFQWQLQPYCNLVSLSVTQEGGLYTLRGTDDQCGTPQRAGAAGLAFQNPDGTIGFGLTIITAPGGLAVHVDATISLLSLSGTWRDSAGNSGPFTFTPGTGQAGSPRPAPSVNIPAGSITAVQLAPGAVGPAQLMTGAVGAAQLAANAVTGANVVDGSLTGTDLANAAIGTAKLANNAVTGAKVANGSLSAADLGDAPRVAHVDLASFSLANVGGAQTVGSVPITAPANGNVIVTVSGKVTLTSGGGGSSFLTAATCGLTTGTTDTAGAFTVSKTWASGESSMTVPFSATRMFTVAAGTTTARLLCSWTSGLVTLGTMQFVAVFVPIS